MKNSIKKFIPQFSKTGFWNKLSQYARKIGLKSVYSALLMFYALLRKETPSWAKNIMLGTLGYLIAPIDAIPDLTPVLGFTDDIAVLSFGLVTVACYINEPVREKSRMKIKKWFGEYDETVLLEVDKKL
ncbi:MAG: DUF1232 domain-containing protein [Bacteroidetes bacterium]|nr:DUF1232 domain-containing protein [Bacteroidota bacterium]